MLNVAEHNLFFLQLLLFCMLKEIEKKTKKPQTPLLYTVALR